MALRKALTLLLLVTGIACNTTAQSRKDFALHISSPTGLLSKFRLKGEFRFDSTHSILLCYTQYWGIYPSFLTGGEYRWYHLHKRHGDNYLYCELGGGSSTGYTLFNQDYNPESFVGPTFYGGCGMGRHINFSHFFLDLNGGIRVTTVSNYPHDYFGTYYVFGPGAVVRINLAFGFQTFTHKPYTNRRTR
ncbi:MAG: hypothetical protein V4649_09930 [Bacteroidota bacterium]